jgi:hypothetical protein
MWLALHQLISCSVFSTFRVQQVRLPRRFEPMVGVYPFSYESFLNESEKYDPLKSFAPPLTPDP